MEKIIGKDRQNRRAYTNRELMAFKKQSPNNKISNISTNFASKENKIMKILTMKDSSGRCLKGLYLYNETLKTWVEAFSTYGGIRIFGLEKNEFFVGEYNSSYKEQSNVFSFNGKFEETGEPCLEMGAKMKNGYRACAPLISNGMVFSNRYNDTPKHQEDKMPSVSTKFKKKHKVNKINPKPVNV